MEREYIIKISIIVPVYNKEKYLEKLVSTVEKQTYKNYEIVFIDDGSQDNSLETLEKIKKNNNKIKVYHQTNAGPGAARRYGLSKSEGDLIYFVDADDYLPNDKVLEKIYNIFKNYNPDILLFDRYDIFDNSTSIIKFFNRYKEEIEQGLYKISDFPNAYIPGGLGCKIFKRELLKDDMFINFYNYEDSYTSYLYLDKCKSYYYLNEPLYSIYEGGENISLTKQKSFNQPKYYLEKLFVLKKIYEELKNDSLKNSVNSDYPSAIINIYIYTIKNRVNFKEKKEIKEYLDYMINICKKNKIKFNLEHSKHKIIKFLIYKVILLFRGKKTIMIKN